MRRDLHRLFDLGQLAARPQTGNIDLSPLLRRFPAYVMLQDRPLEVTLIGRQRQWLDQHWGLHRGRCANPPG